MPTIRPGSGEEKGRGLSGKRGRGGIGRGREGRGRGEAGIPGGLEVQGRARGKTALGVKGHVRCTGSGNVDCVRSGIGWS